MKLKYDLLPPDMAPIDNTTKFLQAQKEVHDAYIQWRQLNDQLLTMSRDEKTPDAIQEVQSISSLKNQLQRAMFKRSPEVMVSICPYCQQESWAAVGVFGLTDTFWLREDNNGRDEISDDTLCEHLFCMDGALNLTGQQPTETSTPNEVIYYGKIHMAAEVPFIKPRVLNLPTMLAVIHALPVADKYTAYPIVYYAQKMPSQESFCIGWARTQYVDFHQKSNRQIQNTNVHRATMIGERNDVQEYDLQKWVDKGKVLWVDPVTENHLVSGGKFPYANIPGKRHPYQIYEGKVTDLPNPIGGSPKIKLEW